MLIRFYRLTKNSVSNYCLATMAKCQALSYLIIFLYYILSIQINTLSLRIYLLYYKTLNVRGIKI